MEKENEHATLMVMFLEYLNCLSNEGLKKHRTLLEFWQSLEKPEFYIKYPEMLNEDFTYGISQQISEVICNAKKTFLEFLDSLTKIHSNNVSIILIKARQLMKYDCLVIKEGAKTIKTHSNSYALLHTYKKHCTGLKRYKDEVVIKLKNSIVIEDCMVEDRPIYEGVIKKQTMDA